MIHLYFFFTYLLFQNRLVISLFYVRFFHFLCLDFFENITILTLHNNNIVKPRRRDFKDLLIQKWGFFALRWPLSTKQTFRLSFETILYPLVHSVLWSRNILHFWCTNNPLNVIFLHRLPKYTYALFRILLRRQWWTSGAWLLNTTW